MKKILYHLCTEKNSDQHIYFVFLHFSCIWLGTRGEIITVHIKHLLKFYQPQQRSILQSILLCWHKYPIPFSIMLELLFRVVNCNCLVGLPILWQGSDMPIPLDSLFSQREQRRATVASRWEWLPLATTDHLPACRWICCQSKTEYEWSSLWDGSGWIWSVHGRGPCFIESNDGTKHKMLLMALKCTNDNVGLCRAKLWHF